MSPVFKSIRLRPACQTPCTPVIEFAFPTRDDDRCQTIADHIYTRASHVHQFIDAKDDRHADRSEACGQEAVYRREQDHQ